MALRIGKKKDAPVETPATTSASAPTDDWSEAALLGATDQQDSTVFTPSPAVAPVSFDTPDSADDFVADTFENAQRKKKVSPVLLAGGLVLLLTALGVGAYLSLSAPPEDEAIVLAPSPSPMPKRVAVIPPKPVPKTQPKVVVRPKVGAPVRTVPAGRTGISTAGTKVPAVRPQAGKPPAIVPKPNQPAQVPLMPDGMAGEPGKGSSVGTTVQVVRTVNSPASKLPPTLQAQLKALWKQGADAKHQRNYNGARTAWRKMLKLRPGHPGVQEAIEKLPR